MLSNQKSLGDLPSYASTLGIDNDEFQNCLETNKYAEAIKKDMVLASKLGISAVPGFIIASIDPDHPSKFKGINSIRGAQPFTNFRKLLDQALEEIHKQ